MYRCVRSGIQANAGTMRAERGTGRKGGCGSNGHECKSSCEERGRGNLTQGQRWGAQNRNVTGLRSSPSVLLCWGWQRSDWSEQEKKAETHSER